jgi:hypothetical protein
VGEKQQGAAAAAAERRDPARQRPIAGGSRVGDPPLTTRACADWMGLTSEWIRAAIVEGVTMRGVPVKLKAERLVLNGRTNYRIHLDDFRAFLQRIGWKRIPADRRAPR